MVDEVADARGKEDHHEYVARYKEDWRQELADLADTDREWLDDLYAVVKEISRRIKYHSFDHADPDSDGYCVDELVIDLLALQLELTLHRMPFKRKEAQARAVALAEQMLRVQMGPRVGMSVDADGTVTVPSWMDELEAEANAYAEGWRDRTAELPPLPGVGELAIARVWRWNAP
jgi:hypothetical protein